ncbi:MAG: hypothetical protein A2096_07330 [Spirochaetes bacterium GWF1_41_5]|nr:MAG: hypothetical protein A2096_07330 [Spirochaetes bacterium GWF1_41_5]HBE02483.1 hypothetical protein [Spirochaetia bacterium]
MPGRLSAVPAAVFLTAAVFLLLLDPQYVSEKKIIEKKNMIILIDNSASIKPDLGNIKKSIPVKTGRNTRFYKFGERLTRVSSPHNLSADEYSSWFGPVHSFISGLKNPASVYIISDFSFHDNFTPLGNSNVHYVRTRPKKRDLCVYLEKKENDTAGTADDIEAVVMKNFPGETKINLEISINGKIRMQSVSLWSEQKRLRFRPEEENSWYLVKITCSAENPDDDFSADNNTARAVYRAAEKKIPVVILADTPNYEISFFHSLLRRYSSFSSRMHFIHNGDLPAVPSDHLLVLFAPSAECYRYYSRHPLLLFFPLGDEKKIKSIFPGIKVRTEPAWHEFAYDFRRPFILLGGNSENSLKIWNNFFSADKAFFLPAVKNDQLFIHSSGSSCFFHRENVIFMGIYPLWPAGFVSRSHRGETDYYEAFFYQLLHYAGRRLLAGALQPDFLTVFPEERITVSGTQKNFFLETPKKKRKLIKSGNAFSLADPGFYHLSSGGNTVPLACTAPAKELFNTAPDQYADAFFLTLDDFAGQIKNDEYGEIKKTGISASLLYRPAVLCTVLAVFMLFLFLKYRKRRN